MFFVKLLAVFIVLNFLLYSYKKKINYGIIGDNIIVTEGSDISMEYFVINKYPKLIKYIFNDTMIYSCIGFNCITNKNKKNNVIFEMEYKNKEIIHKIIIKNIDLSFNKINFTFVDGYYKYQYMFDITKYPNIILTIYTKLILDIFIILFY